MTLSAALARTGKWLDTDVPLSDPVLAEVVRSGYQGVFRYVPLPGNSPRFDISAGELSRICAAGLQCGLVQHVRGTREQPLWDPAAHDGAADAASAVDAARAAGYADEAHLWLDLEAIAGTREATIAFAMAWQQAVIAAGFAAGLYHGYAVPLSAYDLYELPGFNSYWTDAGHRSVAHRGNAVAQGAAVIVGGTQFDEDFVAADLFGDLPRVSAAA